MDAAPDRLLAAAVLVPVLRRPGEPLKMVLIRRAGGGIHGGQLAFPGGKSEPQDGSLEETALREAEEEIGVARSQVRILAALAPVDTLASGFRIHPFLARIPPPSAWRFQGAEVDAVLEIAVDELAALQAAADRAPATPVTGADYLPPFCTVGTERLWGATYRIAQQVVPRLCSGEWEL